MKREYFIQKVFIFAVIAAFAAFAMFAVVTAAGVYRHVTDCSAQNARTRLLTTFVRTAVYASECGKGIEVEDIDGLTVLTIPGESMERAVCRRIYCADGYLMERYMTADAAFDPLAGKRICPAEKLYADVTDHLVTVTITDADGKVYTTYATRRAD